MTDKITESVAGEIHKILYGAPMFARANVHPEQGRAQVDMAMCVARTAIGHYLHAEDEDSP